MQQIPCTKPRAKHAVPLRSASWPRLLRTAGLLFCLLSWISCGTASFSSLQLGTTVHITVYNDRLKDHEWDAIQSRIDDYDRLFSSYPNGMPSQIKQLNDAAGLAPRAMHSAVIGLLSRAQSISLQTQNAFAVCIEPLVSLWGIGTINAKVPQASAIEDLRDLLDPRDLVLTETSAFLTKPGMGVDLGGIAKGYIAQEIAEELVALRIEEALLDFGGNIVSIGLKNGTELWRVGIRNPEGAPHELVGIYEIGDATAVVTSGDYERYFEHDGIRYHHILDAKTGYPSSSGLVSSTVISPDAVLADALSTASFVMGAQKAAGLREDYPETEFIFIDAEKSVWVSNPDSFTLLDTEFTLHDWKELQE